MKNKILKNISWLFFDKIIRLFGGLLVGVWVARYLGPEDFGRLSYAAAFVAFFSFMSNLGLNSIVVREIAKGKDVYYKIVGTSFYLKLFGGLLACTTAILCIMFAQKDATTIQCIVVLLALGYLFQSLDIIDYSFQANILSKYVVLARDGAFLVSSILKVLFIILKFEVIYFALAVLLDIFLASLFLIVFYTRTGNSVRLWKYDQTIAKKLLRFSWPLMFSVLFITIYMKIDQVMIEHLLGIKEVGIYSVAVNISEAWYFIPAIIVSSLMPYFVKLKDVDYDRYTYRIQQVYTIMIWMGILIGLLAVFFGKEAIILIFGIEYKNAYEALYINIWTGIFVSLGVASSLILISENLQIYQLISAIILIVVNVTGNWFIIPYWGITGAAITTLVTQGVGLLIIPLFFKPIRKITILSLKSVLPFYLLGKENGISTSRDNHLFKD
ncbi:flippase [Oligoflexia bacterium]|nr:flippase [Oligoflexia bacterium]